MYCNGCGASIAGDARYCHQCGRGTPASFAASCPLERPRQGRKVAGVCLAIANSLHIDVFLTRILTVVLAICTGIVPCIVAYIIAWIVIPEAPSVAVPVPGVISPNA